MSPKETFGELSPWAEPAWYNILDSPYYNSTHRKLAAWARNYIDENVLPYAQEWEESGCVPKEETMKFVSAGFVLQSIPQKYRPGTSLPAGISADDWDIFHHLILTDETARVESGVLTALSGGGTKIGVPPIIAFGTEAQKQAWLPGIFTGETQFCLGATEPSGGSDLANLRTTARKTPDGKFYIVKGTKKWITGALQATHMTTAVRTGGPGAGGVSVLVIPTDLPGFSAKKIYNSGANAANSAWVYLEDVKVPVENIIGQENKGFLTLMTNFNKERFLMSVGSNRKARTCLTTALKYAQDRETFGAPLISNQIIRDKFATIARGVESNFAWLEQIAYHASRRGWSGPELASRMALSKVNGTRLLELACREAQQVLGGAGYQRGGVGWQVEQISRDLRMYSVGGGSEEIISDLAVRQELKVSKALGAKL